MNFDYSEEQQLLADSVARFLRERYDFDARRRIVASDTGWSARHWASFAELGWLAVALPEEHGGLGGGAVDLAILFEQFGRSLVVEPYLATMVLGAGTLAALGDGAEREALLGRAIEGGLQLALATVEPQSRYALEDIATRATPAGEDRWWLDGRKCVVLNAPAADLLLVSARDAQGEAGVYLVERGAEGLSLLPYPTIDGARAADLSLSSTPATRLAGGADPLAALAAVHDRAALCVCAEAVGAMGALLEKTVAYTKVRRQFGVPIASFQALQHRMADMFIELEQSRSILLMAQLVADGGAGGTARAVSAAKARIGRAARRVGEEAIQLHGGIGVTDELDIGHYVKRLVAIEALFGNGDWHLARFGANHD